MTVLRTVWTGNMTALGDAGFFAAKVVVAEMRGEGVVWAIGK